ncbi:MAG: lyase [Acidimicrobiia bacterium]|nr:lyase [Acidimicrobiia bacterium]
MDTFVPNPRTRGPRFVMGPVLLAAVLVFTACVGTEFGSVDESTVPPTTAAVVASSITAPSTTEAAGASTTSSSTTSTPETEVLQSFPASALEVVAFPVPAGSRPHDVAPAADGGVWYTAQGSGELGWLDPESGETRHIPLGAGSRPHGVIVGDDGTAWVTDGGLNAIVSVDADDQVVVYPLPADRPDANLNTAAFDGAGLLWFTGQNGIYGSLDPTTGDMEVFDAPLGRGPYGIAATPLGTVYFASLAGSYVGLIAPDGSVTVLDPPTPGQGARRVWSDSAGSIWVSEWNSGQLSRYVPDTGQWTTWPLPGDSPSAYAVYVDEFDDVWVSDFGGNAMHRFGPSTETFDTFDLPSDPSNVRQILGRPGEVWGAESAADQLVVIRARS